MANNSTDDGILFQLMNDLNINVSNEEDDNNNNGGDGIHQTISNDIEEDVDEGVAITRELERKVPTMWHHL
jgi:hypothetical protein